MEVDRNGLAILDRAECLRLLGAATIGRVGLTSGALPTVLPVNFCLDGERILIRTTPGSKLDAAARNAVVAFEADDMDPIEHSGWSVMVTGVAREVALGSLDPHQRTVLARWAPSANGETRVIAISTEVISGRRIVPGLMPLRALRRNGGSKVRPVPG